ncbi:GNAT family N-acetyltransferase [Paenibacillus sp. MMS20-IR301]|uniref:GNAT family N-acetyltransferase n=1 Tax=Paenibacillus sp. MMS20-IR301 TaxID=2895946 RepID=UPI0028E45226|nr:GNAT family N-acetyltransferase [Paenibacillus sp. MMS20-IR301]WNS42524.1 GNAT family N-acetyltransferase [Paenibacillus sp. MMS20-IR301]
MLLQSDIIDVRSTAAEDLDFVLAAERDGLNSRYVGKWSREQHAGALSDKDTVHLIVLNKAGERAGYVILTGLQDPNLTVCIKRIVIQAKGRGYGTRLLAMLSSWVFTYTDTHRLWLDVKDHNARAQHVYAKAGFKPEGTLRECVRTEDGFDSLMIMSILRQEYGNG